MMMMIARMMMMREGERVRLYESVSICASRGSTSSSRGSDGGGSECFSGDGVVVMVMRYNNSTM